MKLNRRTIIKGAAAAAATLALPAQLGRAQTGKKISILTWNIPGPGRPHQRLDQSVSGQARGRRGRMARQEGAGTADLLSDPARGGDTARHHQHARRALARIRRQRRAPGSDARRSRTIRR